MKSGIGAEASSAPRRPRGVPLLRQRDVEGSHERKTWVFEQVNSLYAVIGKDVPRNGESKCPISLQSLLNALDGVATGEGLVIVATANEPAALDPATLRRPGRFDRVVRFGNPNRRLREQFFLKMKLKIDPSF